VGSYFGKDLALLLYIFIYNILRLSGGGRPFHPFVPSSVQSSIHPSKFLIPDEEDGRGGGQRRMAASANYPNVYVIQSCTL
jgi:hypothetical protein